jgi:PAS domain S-box-containing protein
LFSYYRKSLYVCDSATLTMIDDMTEKNSAGHQLKESEHRFRVLAEASVTGIYMLQEMKFKYVNPRLCQMLGYREDELLQEKDPLDLVHPDDVEMLVDLRERWLHTDMNSFDLDFRAITRNKKVINVQVFGSRIEINGKSAVIGVVIDDTAHKNAIKNFRLSLESYKTLFDTIGDAIYIQDKDGSFLEVNDGVVELYGYDKTFFIGKYPEVLAAPGKVNLGEMEEYFDLAIQGKPQRFEWWGRRKNGEVFPKEVQLNPGTYFGESVVIGIVRDISEQYFRQEKIKESEEMFRQLFKNAPIGIAMLDEHKEVTMINKGFEEIFGYTENEIVGLDLDKIIVPEGLEEEAATLTRSTKTYRISSRRTRKDGSFVDVLIYGVPVIVNGRTIAVYGIYVDITDRIEAENQIKQSLKEKEVLLSEIHHRVKNNLAVITGLLELQGYNTDSEEAKKVLKDSQLRINSMALIHEKLYQSENLSEIQFDVYIEELLQVISKSHVSKEKPIHVEIDAEPVPLTITQAIPCGLLLNEIVTNSLKHAFEGRSEGVIRITFKKTGDKLQLSIGDNGVGLPENYKEIKSKSLGMTLINTLAKQLEAEMFIDTREGTRYDLIFDYEEVDTDD